MTMIKPLGLGAPFSDTWCPDFQTASGVKHSSNVSWDFSRGTAYRWGLRGTAREHYGGFSVPGDDRQDMMTIGRQMIDKFYS